MRSTRTRDKAYGVVGVKRSTSVSTACRLSLAALTTIPKLYYSVSWNNLFACSNDRKFHNIYVDPLFQRTYMATSLITPRLIFVVLLFGWAITTTLDLCLKAIRELWLPFLNHEHNFSDGLAIAVCFCWALLYNYLGVATLEIENQRLRQAQQQWREMSYEAKKTWIAWEEKERGGVVDEIFWAVNARGECVKMRRVRREDGKNFWVEEVNCTVD